MKNGVIIKNMEPKKKLKKFNEFKIKKKRGNLSEYPIPQLPIYRYLMEFPFGDTMFYCTVNCELPSVSMRTGRLGFNITHYQPEWEPIQVKIRDVIGDERNRSLFYSRIRDWFSDYNYTNKKINTTISRVDPTGVTVDRWDLRGCFITAIHYGNAYMVDSEPELEFTLHYDFCNYISDI